VAQGYAGSVWNSTQLAMLDKPHYDDSWSLENDRIPGESGSSEAVLF
jgi:hypothetical protein